MSVKEQITERLKYGSTLFYLAFCLYLYKQGMETTMFPYNFVFSRYSQYIIIFLLSVKILLYDHCGIKQMALSALMVGLTVIVAFSSTHTELVMWILLVLGARNVPVEKILRLYLWITGAIVLVAIVASQLGIIENLVYTAEGETARNALGLVYPTDFMAHIFGLVTVWLYLHRERLHRIEVALLLTGTVVLFSLTYAKLDSSCIVLLILMTVIIQWTRSRNDLLVKKYRLRWEKCSSLVCMSVFPAFAVLSVCATLILGEKTINVAPVLGTFFSRFDLGRAGLEQMGVKLFGQSVTMVGAGGGTDYRPDYNFIDCSYLNILIQFGPLFLFMVLAILTFVCKKYSRDRYMMAILFCWGLNSVVAHHLVEITYNVFPLLLYAGGAEAENTWLAAIGGKIRTVCNAWKERLQQQPVPSEIQCIQGIGLLLIVLTNCLPELMVNDRLDTSRILWKCLTADGAALFLLTAGMQLFRETSWKTVFVRNIRNYVLPLWGVGMLGWFFSRWFSGGWDFWWGMWHVKTDWIGFLQNLLLLKNPFYYMEQTRFLHVYFFCLLLFPIWKRGICWIVEEKARWIILALGALLFLMNDASGNRLEISDSGWKTVLPVVWLLSIGAFLESYRNKMTKSRNYVAVGLICLYLGGNMMRWLVQTRYSAVIKQSDILRNGFSGTGMCIAIVLLWLCLWCIEKVKNEKKYFAIGISSKTILQRCYMLFLWQGILGCWLLRLDGGRLSFRLLSAKRMGALGEIVYSGLLFGMIAGVMVLVDGLRKIVQEKIQCNNINNCKNKKKLV